MKQIFFILILLVVGLFIGIFFSYGVYYGIHKTSSENFCVLCHEMDPMVIAYKNDPHGGKSKIGASARCVDCHLPHDSLVNYIYTKATTGVKELGIHFFGNVDEIDWQKMREDRESFVYDEGCLNCHGNIFDKKLATLSSKAQKMHNHYNKLKGTKQEVKCAFCHFEVGHTGLRNYLNYYNPEHSIYKEKMENKKEQLLNEYKEYGIKTK